MCLQEDGDTKKLFTAGAAYKQEPIKLMGSWYKTMFECENFPKKLWSRPLGPPVHTVKRKQFSYLPSPPLPFSFLSSQLSRRTHPETLATPDKRCLHITFVFRSLPWSPSFIVNLHHFTIRSQHAALRKEQRPPAVILNYYAKHIDNFYKQSTVEPR